MGIGRSEHKRKVTSGGSGSDVSWSGGVVGFRGAEKGSKTRGEEG
jgi:hypothetical protein